MSLIFDAYSTYYDLLYRDKDYAAESKFISEILESHIGSKKGSILELGCGTGIHAEHLSNMGFDVTGVDLSAKMIEVARSRSSKTFNSKIKFAVSDVRSVRLNSKFDSVISLFHVASYQTSNFDILSMFETASTHLKSNGIFIFDCWYGPAVLSNPPELRVKRINSELINILRIAEPTIFPNENIVNVNYTVQVKSTDGKHSDEFIESHNMRYFFSPEIDFYLQQSGMRLIKRVEWLTGSPIGLNTWGAVFFAVKLP